MLFEKRARRSGCSGRPPAQNVPPVFHLDCTYLLVLLVQLLALLNAPKTAGVTHWKLSDNEIIPGPSSSDTQSEDGQHKSDNLYTVSQFSSSDPEFAMLVRYSARGSSGGGGGGSAGSLNRGGGGFGTFRRQGGSLGSCILGDEELEGLSRCNVGGAGDGKEVKKSDTPAAVKQPRKSDGSIMSENEVAVAQINRPLTCGEPVEYTVYDFLKGVARRVEHRNYPEPEVAMIFKKPEEESVDIFKVEMELRKAYQENPNSLTVLNQVGNYWRVKGNTQYSIECFRKALHISSDHPDLLLNLARVLFNLQFYDDAIFLAKRSLHMKSSESQAWLQYFTLGEVSKAMEKYEEAAFYFRRSLQHNPGLHQAERYLKEMGLDQTHSVNVYTLFIIFTLVAVVLAMIYYLICAMNG